MEVSTLCSGQMVIFYGILILLALDDSSAKNNNNKGVLTYYILISLKFQREFCDNRPLKLIMDIGHNNFEVIEDLVS